MKSIVKKISHWNKERLARRRAKRTPVYQQWVTAYDSPNAVLLESFRRRAEKLGDQGPLISIVMPVFNPKIEHLREAIASVKGQAYGNWELCIADDKSTDPKVREELERQAEKEYRIKLVFREENGHICAASNSALAIATGDYIALLDHDDLLPPHALLFVAETITRNPSAGVIYSDEDKIDEKGKRFHPQFKPDWNLFLLRSQNYISHLGVYRRSLVNEVGGFRPGYEGAQDYDLVLRCIEKLHDNQIIHIPFILYHWRAHSASTATSVDTKPYASNSSSRALSDHLKRTETLGTVESEPVYYENSPQDKGKRGKAESNPGYHQIKYAIPNPSPKVALLIPTRDKIDLLQPCVNSVLAKTTYKNYEIIIIDNGSKEPQTFKYFDHIKKIPNVTILRDDGPFNYSRINNRAAATTRADLLCLLNNDIEVIEEDWLTEMVSVVMQPGVGAVGAKLLYSNGLIQHGGVILGIGGVAGHAHKMAGRLEPGYFGRLVLNQELSAVTAACLLVRASAYWDVHGLDEDNLEVAFNDVDFCLKLREAGYKIIYAPAALMYHHESASRGADILPEKAARFLLEERYLQHRWQAALQRDPAYNPNLTIHAENFGLAFPPRVRLDDPYWQRPQPFSRPVGDCPQ